MCDVCVVCNVRVSRVCLCVVCVLYVCLACVSVCCVSVCVVCVLCVGVLLSLYNEAYIMREYPIIYSNQQTPSHSNLSLNYISSFSLLSQTST